MAAEVALCRYSPNGYHSSLLIGVRLMIVTFCRLEASEISRHQPKILILDQDNEVAGEP